MIVITSALDIMGGRFEGLPRSFFSTTLSYSLQNSSTRQNISVTWLFENMADFFVNLLFVNTLNYKIFASFQNGDNPILIELRLKRSFFLE